MEVTPKDMQDLVLEAARMREERDALLDALRKEQEKTAALRLRLAEVERDAVRLREERDHFRSSYHAAIARTAEVERERCAELRGLLLQVAPWIGGVPFHPDTVADVAAAKRRIYEIIEGAPAPREG